MKCHVCQYEHEEEFDSKCRTFITSKGDEKFIVIEGTFFVKNSNGYSESISTINLYACPKCKTVKLYDNF